MDQEVRPQALRLAAWQPRRSRTVPDYTLESGHVRAWHHRDLTGRVAVGDPVRVHEEYYALAIPSAWLCMVIASGLGAVPEPSDPELWRVEMTVGVTNLATAEALPMDRPDVADE